MSGKTKQVAKMCMRKLLVHLLMWLPWDIILYSVESLILLVAVAMARYSISYSSVQLRKCEHCKKNEISYSTMYSG